MTTNSEPPDRAGVRVVLTAQEWARQQHGCVTALRDGSGRFYVIDSSDAPARDEVAYVPDESLPALIALANDALPAASPYRIERADVEALRALVTDADDFEIATHAHDWDALARFAAKLEALLRPES